MNSPATEYCRSFNLQFFLSVAPRAKARHACRARFDLALITLILASVVVVILDSVDSLTADHDVLFDVLEWTFTIVFTIEYLARLASTCGQQANPGVVILIPAS